MARLEEYCFGRLRVDGEEHTRDLIVLPQRVVPDWWRRDGHSLAMEGLDEVLDGLPARLVLGVGAYGRLRPDPELVREESAVLGAALRRVLDRLSERGRALAVGHSPTNEAAVLGLTGSLIEPMAKGAGV